MSQVLSETVELRGHLIDSLILPKVLDEVLGLGGDFRLLEVRIGQRREEPSYARIEIEAPDRPTLDRILGRIKLHGAEVLDEGDALLSPAPADGVFPEGFYITTGQLTQVRLGGQWQEIRPCRAGCAIAVRSSVPYPVSFAQVRQGALIVTGHTGVRVRPVQRATGAQHPLEFLATPFHGEVSREAVIGAVAQEMRAVRENGGRVMLVAGEAVVSTGGSRHLMRLLELGYVQLFLAGNDLAIYDAAQALYRSTRPEERLRAANAIRREGGLRAAVASGLLAGGVLHTCLQKGVDLLLVGSVRDEGFLPEALTDVLEAQQVLAEKAGRVSLALMVATGLYSLALTPLLPPPAWAICADLNPSLVARVTQRGSFRTVGLVTDAEPFLHMLLGYLE